MGSDYAKLGLQERLNAIATKRVRREIEMTGRALPCVVTAVAGSIVTVSFEVQSGGLPVTLPFITLPKAESQWVRSATQVGDFGLTIPADTFLGGISGLGAGVADLDIDYGNLATLVWVPCGNIAFPPNTNPLQSWVNGPGGAKMGDTAETVEVICDTVTGTVTLRSGASNLVLSATRLVIDGASAPGNAIVRQTDLQSWATTFATNIWLWAQSNFATGTSSPATGPTVPTPSGSTKSFTA